MEWFSVLEVQIISTVYTEKPIVMQCITITAVILLSPKDIHGHDPLSQTHRTFLGKANAASSFLHYGDGVICREEHKDNHSDPVSE